MVGLARFELTQLRPKRRILAKLYYSPIVIMVHAPRIELGTMVCKTTILPLDYACMNVLDKD